MKLTTQIVLITPTDMPDQSENPWQTPQMIPFLDLYKRLVLCLDSYLMVLLSLLCLGFLFLQIRKFLFDIILTFEVFESVF